MDKIRNPNYRRFVIVQVNDGFCILDKHRVRLLCVDNGAKRMFTSRHSAKGFLSTASVREVEF